MFRESSAESEHTGHHDPDHEDWDAASDSAMAAGSLNLELKITDAEVITALSAHTPGREQRDFALTALRIGVLALRQAQGLVDADTVKHEGETVLFYHRNRDDKLLFDYMVKQQGLEAVRDQLVDTQKNRTFGGILKGKL